MREYDRARVLTDEQVEHRREYLRQYVEANREHRAAYTKAWAEANREARSNGRNRRRARLLAATVVDITVDQLRAKWDYWAGRCWMCSEPAAHWDHVKPLSKGGGHILSNLRPACASCNLRKRDRWPYAYHKH
jgi:5-methylcytosine-specific restriction endonuclease McrA